MSMDRKKRIIDNLFDNKFNMDSFKDFVANVLNARVLNRGVNVKIKKVFMDYIENDQTIADYKDKNSNNVTVLAVKIKDDRDPIKARVKQREFVATYLRDKGKDGALVVFYNEESSHFRISFVKLDLEFTAEGIKEKLTPAKRLSYVVGEDEACKTAKSQFSDMLGKLEDSITLDQLESVFALEKVTNEFFKEYKEKYLEIRDLLVKDKVFMEEAKKHEIEKPESFAEGFTKKLLGQISFLYFLQKKGWLGVKTVPIKLSSSEYDRIYTRALNKEKEVLERAYERVDADLFRLDSSAITIEDGDDLARAFINTEYSGDWGDGDKKFVRHLFELYMKKDKETDKTFFDDYLEVLFYNNLSKARGEVQYSIDFNTRIPFLNGGLFDPYGDYNWEETEFALDDEIFSNELGTGILDIFDTYNFTINENDSYETEVAVDPEMLGKVFENLLDVTDRKSKGSFYTPREIVRYMTNESVINHILSHLEGTNVTKEDMDYIFKLGEFTKEYDTQLYERDYLGKEEDIKGKWGMPSEIIKHSIQIDNLLKNIKIADPACGSGAFPLGVLNEIVRARDVLTFYINVFEVEKDKDKKHYWKRKGIKENDRKLYKLKLHSIQNSLYGVDIEPSAIDITKLRLWLSILVDSDNSNVKPLPNLDFNFMIGNSLVDEFEGMKLFDESLLEKEYFTEEEKKLEQKKLYKEKKMVQDNLFVPVEQRKTDLLKDIFVKQEKYFNEINSDKKKKLKRDVESLEMSLIEITLRSAGKLNRLEEIRKGRKERRKPYFLWKLEFARVFKENGGFDIVIGNPPYVGEKGNKELFHSIRHSGLQKFYIQKVDLFYFFFHLGLNILKETGKLAFITTNYYLTADGALKLREDFKKRSHLEKLINFNEITIFETAKGQHNLITILEKNTGSKENKETKTIVCSDKVTLKDIDEVLHSKSPKAKYYNMSFDKLYEGTNNYIRLETDRLIELLDRINRENKTLKEFCNVNQGLRTGADKLTNSHIKKNLIVEEKGKGIFVLKKDEYMELLPKLNEFERSCYKPLFKNSDISKYIVNEEVNYYFLDLACPRDKHIPKESIPNIIEYLEPFRSILENRKETANGVRNAIEEGIWWLISVRRKLDFSLEKLVAPQRSKTNVFGYNNTEWNSSADVYYVTKKTEELDLKYILAILNSKLCYAWLYKKGKRKGEMLELYATPLEQIPIKIVSKEEQQKYIDIVDRIIELKKQDKDTEELERRVDQMVYKLYDLTDEEIEIVEDSI